MSILRLIGQRGLLGADAPVRHSEKRGRTTSCSQSPRSAAKSKPGASRIPEIAHSERRGVGHTRCAQACERLGVVMSTGKGAGKPRGNAIDVRIDILAVKLRLEVDELS